MRLAKILPPLLAFLFLGVGGWRVSKYIESKHQAFQGREYAQAHPLLSWLGPSQSATQNGFTMLAVQDAAQAFQYQEADGSGSFQFGGDSLRRGDTAFWFTMDSPPAGMPPYASSQTTTNANLFTITAHAPNGDTFPLDWEMNSSQPRPLFHATLPAGYPDTYQWIDLTVSDRQGQTATWRINHLPPTQHLIPSPVRVQSTYKNGGVTLTASAWRERDPYNQRHAMTAMYQMRGLIRPYQHQWEVAFVGHQWEWGSANAPPQNGIMSEGFNAAGVFNNGDDSVVGGYSGQALPYLNRNHYVRLFCELRQFETSTETVTFRNVPLRKDSVGAWCIARALSLKTPSGITVSLPDVTSVRRYDTGFGKDGIWYQVLSQPQNGAASLPGSPLWRKYRQPLDIFAYPNFPKGYQEGGGENSMNFFRGPLPPSHVLKTFRVDVQQRVTLRRIPATFTLPILPRKPEAAK